jgi:hypothetical protein
MTAIKAVFDGKSFIPQEPIAMTEQCEVVITFLKKDSSLNPPLPNPSMPLLDYFGTWNRDDLDVMQSIIEERQNFSLERAEC